MLVTVLFTLLFTWSGSGGGDRGAWRISSASRSAIAELAGGGPLPWLSSGTEGRCDELTIPKRLTRPEARAT
jgi:hypothetical protein